MLQNIFNLSGAPISLPKIVKLPTLSFLHVIKVAKWKRWKWSNGNTMDRLDGAFLTSASCKVGSGPEMVPTNQIQITQSTCIALHYIVLHCIVIIMIRISITTSIFCLPVKTILKAVGAKDKTVLSSPFQQLPAKLTISSTQGFTYRDSQTAPNKLSDVQIIWWTTVMMIEIVR